MKPGNEPMSPSMIKHEIYPDVRLPGITIRQHACLAAMQGMLASEIESYSYRVEELPDVLARDDKRMAIRAVEIADAVLKREAETREGKP